MFFNRKPRPNLWAFMTTEPISINLKLITEAFESVRDEIPPVEMLEAFEDVIDRNPHIKKQLERFIQNGKI